MATCGSSSSGMIAEQPRHGYELMKGIEERMGGGYSPSPGVIYPTLAWLEDMGYATADAEGSRRSYRVTAGGRGLPRRQPGGAGRAFGAAWARRAGGARAGAGARGHGHG